MYRHRSFGKKIALLAASWQAADRADQWLKTGRMTQAEYDAHRVLACVKAAARHQADPSWFCCLDHLGSQSWTWLLETKGSWGGGTAADQAQIVVHQNEWLTAAHLQVPCEPSHTQGGEIAGLYIAASG